MKQAIVAVAVNTIVMLMTLVTVATVLAAVITAMALMKRFGL